MEFTLDTQYIGWEFMHDWAFTIHHLHVCAMLVGRHAAAQSPAAEDFQQWTNVAAVWRVKPKWAISTFGEVHTCKAWTFSSCGYRATVQWQRERWAVLPDVPYKGITFTMPDVLWPLFRDNPHLARALPPLAAAVLQTRIAAQHGAHRVIDILHTFNGKLEFNSHVHALVTAGGLRDLLVLGFLVSTTTKID